MIIIIIMIIIIKKINVQLFIATKFYSACFMQNND